MIHRIKFSNFYSFDDEQTIDFVVNDNAPDTEAYVRTPFGERVGKVLVAYGHNASGKTNLIRVLGFLRSMLVGSFDSDPGEKIPYETFMFGKLKRAKKDKSSLDSKIQVEFELNAKLFGYVLSFNQARILSEELYIKHRGDLKFSYVFLRNFDAKSGEYRIAYNTRNKKVPNISIPNKFEASKKRSNASLISIGAQVSDDLCEQIRNYWKTSTINVSISGRQFLKTWENLGNATKVFGSYPELFEYAKRILRRCDLGLSDITIDEVAIKSDDQELERMDMPFGVHKIGREKVDWPFYFESDGTMGLYLHLAKLLLVLKGDGFAAIDEFDSDLHPLTIPKLLDLFLSRDSNPNNDQLICTCHSTPLLNHLDKYQVLLVEKGEDLASRVWRLDEIKGIRADENLFGKYMAGAYGAVPDF